MGPVRTAFAAFAVSSLLVLVTGQTSPKDPLCSSVSPVYIHENNTVGAHVTTITAQPGVGVHLSPPSDNNNDQFFIEGTDLKAAKVLDYEVPLDTAKIDRKTYKSLLVRILCIPPSPGQNLTQTIIVILQDVNDNPPVFGAPAYTINVSELLRVGEKAGNFEALDLDNNQLFYTLTSDSTLFQLRSPNSADILVNSRLDYDTVKSVQLTLTVQDTPPTPPAEGPSYTSTTSITVNIVDSDNRPPWFQPCTPFNIGFDKLCQVAGYTGRVVLNEMETGALPLKPGPLYAIDGDSGINEPITYSIISGNEGGLFAINPDTGNITMLKAADVVGPVVLTVLGAQTINSYQFSTTTVTISVQVKSLHKPVFQQLQYEGIITSAGGMAMDATNKDRPLRIIATDEDYSAAGGINPHITYTIEGSSAFSIVDGHLFMTTNLPDSTVTLQVIATDASNDESATAQLTVEVKSGVPTTTLPPSTTGLETTPPTEEPTTDGKTTDPISTASPPTTATPVTGDYGAADMAALGATLGVLLFICLVVIGLLVHHMRKGRASLKKVFEASVFRSALGGSGQKEGIQYTNEAFQDDEDGGSTGSGDQGKGIISAGGGLTKSSWDTPSKEATQRSSAPLHDLLPDSTSEAGSDKNDNGKEVKPILTKERRVEEGYKSVWFKEDIDPEGKEEVVIIPERGEEDDSEEDGDGDVQTKPSRVKFTETDLDSGLGVKMEDPAEDSDSARETLNVDL